MKPDPYSCSFSCSATEPITLRTFRDQAMRWIISLPMLALMGVLLASCDEHTNSGARVTSSDTATSQDLQFFSRSAETPLAHFRVRWIADTVGRRTNAQGHLEVVNEYLSGVPVTAEFYLQPGVERLAIASGGDGKTTVLYLKNLQIVDDHAEADVWGVANNFGFRGPPGVRIGAGGRMSRAGTPEAPKPELFVIGKPKTIPLGRLGMHSSNEAMGKDYEVMSRTDCVVELLAITNLSEVLADDPSLDNAVPAAVQDQAIHDTYPATTQAVPNHRLQLTGDARK